MIVCPRNEIFLHARFDEGGLLVTEGNEGVAQVEVEVEVVLVVEVVDVVDFVGFVRVQGEHAVEYGIEVVGKMVEEEMGVASAIELVEREAERHWRGLPKDPQGRTALNTFFWRLPLRYFSSSSSWSVSIDVSDASGVIGTVLT